MVAPRHHIFMVGVTAPEPCVTFNLPQAEVLALTRNRKGASVRELTKIIEIRMAVLRNSDKSKTLQVHDNAEWQKPILSDDNNIFAFGLIPVLLDVNYFLWNNRP